MVGYKILQAEEKGIYVLKFVGEIRLNLCSTLDNLVESITQDPNFRTVVIDLSETEVIDSTTLGLLAKIALAAKKQSGCTPSLISTHPDITRIIGSMGFDSIFIIVSEPVSSMERLEEIPELKASEQQVRDKVLEAHKILMGMNSRNREEFKNLVHALECEETG
ncbi:STAS domain-containing protein [Marinobacter sp. M3C]|jgi:anti-anti-sigma factor|uniref:STAS domain-containing protein n=1 Tax=unclassified Marinobacter TaxID=83889 RepID=UPI00200C9271|nr:MULTISPECIES: STAS domain-containing protein [unclassified Marinobacter]MCL1476172.1 STAS domain-containing protein [Marinobacter sp.]MCL1482724.1 STAS domain-containing protein [Marinobacter sp.]MCL1482923.1 STAS domain-containing protein [Marinobacter sp.]MCL1488743.1 STAS domain-containing protein [Marinobacter sp.]UQG54058.1 STAS domain-containing protein [Marinobacter sp. M4C]